MQGNFDVFSIRPGMTIDWNERQVAVLDTRQLVASTATT